MNEIVRMELVGIPLILGRKPLDLPAPVVLTCETEIAHTFERLLLTGEVEMSPNPIHSYVVGRTYCVYSAGRLVATTTKFKPVRDAEGKTVAVRLFKNQTTFH